MGLCAKKIIIPDAQHRQDHRHILRQWRRRKMVVHGMRAFEQLNEVVFAYQQDDGQADG